jgi:hypothetical protein
VRKEGFVTIPPLSAKQKKKKKRTKKKIRHPHLLNCVLSTCVQLLFVFLGLGVPLLCIFGCVVVVVDTIIAAKNGTPFSLGSRICSSRKRPRRSNGTDG